MHGCAVVVRGLLTLALALGATGTATARAEEPPTPQPLVLERGEGKAPLVSAALQGVRTTGAGEVPRTSLRAASVAAPSSWVTLSHSEVDQSGAVWSVATGAQRILFRRGDAVYVFDRSLQRELRVDTAFDGTPRPRTATDFIIDGGISGDGDTVVLLRATTDDEPDPLKARIVRLDGDLRMLESFEVSMPDPGTQTWSSGWVEQCSLFTRRGRIQVTDDGDRFWFRTSPCFYNRVLVVDISANVPHWTFVQVLDGDDTAHVTADGKRIYVGGDFYTDWNQNGQRDPDEPLSTWQLGFDIHLNDGDGLPAVLILQWPFLTSFSCHFPPGGFGQPDGQGNRFLLNVDAVGLDPDTIVYQVGRQYYWAGRGCRLHSAGRAKAMAPSEFRFSTDGRVLLDGSNMEGATERRELLGSGRDTYSDVPVFSVDPLITTAARHVSHRDPSTGALLGSSLQYTILTGLTRSLKVAVLGDSYISGEGTFGYEAGTDDHGDATRNLCHRSFAAWGYQLAARLANYRLDDVAFLACSGATTRQITGPNVGNHEGSQIGRLRDFNDGRPVDVVFIGAGGNDAGFKDIVVTCLALDCTTGAWRRDRLKDARHAAVEVVRMLEQVREAAPRATVFLMGYPSIVDPEEEGCQDLGATGLQRFVLQLSKYTAPLERASGGLRITVDEQKWMNDDLLPTLNGGLEKAAAEAGVHWIDPTGWFSGHNVCSSDPFGNGLVGGDDIPEFRPLLGNESFHPNAKGHESLSARVESRFGASFGPDGNPPRAPQGLVDEGPSDTLGFVVVDGQFRAWGNRGEISVQGLPDGTQVVVALFSSPTLLAEGTVGPDGTVELPYTVPAGLYPGLHRLVVFEKDTGRPLAATFVGIDPPTDCLVRSDDDVDGDGDALVDRCDASLEDGPLADLDGDTVPNVDDACPEVADSAQADGDEDGTGDACDPDLGYNPVDTLEEFPVVELPRPAPAIDVGDRPARFTNLRDAAVAFSVSEASSVTCALDGAADAPCSSPYELTGLTDGPHSLIVRAQNVAGVRGTATVEWTVDTAAPTVVFLNRPAPVGGSAAFIAFGASNFLGESPIAGYWCSVDGAAETACGTSLSLWDLTDGTHTVSVVAEDEAGNRSLPATVTWGVDRSIGPSFPSWPVDPSLPGFEESPGTVVEPWSARLVVAKLGRVARKGVPVRLDLPATPVACTVTVTARLGGKAKVVARNSTVSSGVVRLSLKLRQPGRRAAKRRSALRLQGAVRCAELSPQRVKLTARTYTRARE